MMKLVLPYGIFQALLEESRKQNVSMKGYIIHVLSEHFKKMDK